MPHKKAKVEFDFPEWVESLRDRCLYTTVSEAFVARKHAVNWGALQHRDTAALVRSADTTIQMIADGRVEGEPACKKAADALRKYSNAGDIAYILEHPIRRRVSGHHR